MEETIGCPDAPKAPKIDSEMIQRTSARAFRALGRSWRALNNEKPQKHYGCCMSGNEKIRSIFEKTSKTPRFFTLQGGPDEPVLAREREARFKEDRCRGMLSEMS